eukprot:4997609-Alexandrium_andersonii.AAC.1
MSKRPPLPLPVRLLRHRRRFKWRRRARPPFLRRARAGRVPFARARSRRSVFSGWCRVPTATVAAGPGR